MKRKRIDYISTFTSPTVEEEELTDFLTKSPEERYKQLLSHRPELLQRVAQHQIASYLGVTLESLSRIRKRLAAK